MKAPLKPAHPNRVPFEGILTRLDTPSDRPPSGSRDHRVILTTAAAQEALWSLEGMAVGFTPNWDGHDARRKCGVIAEAWIDGDKLRVKGHLFCRDFPEISEYLGRPDVELGMSYELCDVHVEDMTAKVWKLTHVTFTGAAVLLRDRAAYRDTTFTIAAATEQYSGKMVFVDEGSIKPVVAKTGRGGRSARRR